MDGSASPDVRELRIFLENVICDLCRLHHASRDGIPPGSTQIHQEVRLSPGVFADIRVAAGALPPYFVEVNLGHSRASVAESVRRKYGRRTPASEGASRVVIVVDRVLGAGEPPLETELAGPLAPGLRLERWDEAHLAGLIRDTFAFALPCFAD